MLVQYGSGKIKDFFNDTCMLRHLEGTALRHAVELTGGVRRAKGRPEPLRPHIERPTLSFLWVLSWMVRPSF